MDHNDVNIIDDGVDFVDQNDNDYIEADDDGRLLNRQTKNMNEFSKTPDDLEEEEMDQEYGEEINN